MWKVDWNYALNLQVGLLLLWKKNQELCAAQRNKSAA